MIKRRTGSFWGLLALALIFSGAAQASQTAAPKPATAARSQSAASRKASAVHEISNSGVITSIDATRLVMTHKVKGKDEQATLVLTPETKREGTLTTGSRVSVRYRMENGDQVATLVRGQTVAAKTKSPATAKKS